MKEEGNEYFKQQNYKKALSCYAKVPLFLNGLLSEEDELSKYAQNNPEVMMNKEELDIVGSLKQTTYLNMSQIHIYNKQWSKALEKATKSLEIKETSKGYFRRGTAALELNDLDLAGSDFKRVKEIEPDNAIVDQKIQLVNKKLSAQDKQLGAKLKGMFFSD